MGRKSSTNVLSRFLSQPAEYGFEGRYEAEAIAAMVDRNFILNEAMQLITAEE